MKRLAGTATSAQARCESQTFLKNGLLPASSAARSSQALRYATRISGGVRSTCTPCFSRNSFSASAFSLWFFAIHEMNASRSAERTCSWCSGERLFHTSRLKVSSPMVLFSCRPGV